MRNDQPDLSPSTIQLDGAVYSDLPAAARARGVPLETVKRRLAAGRSLSEALTPGVTLRKKSVTVHGVAYPSVQEACEAIGLSYGTYEDRRRKGMSREDALSKPVSANRGTAIELKGNSYPSIRAAADVLGLSPGTVRRRLALGQSLETPRQGARGKLTGKRITIDGVTYRSYTEACKAKGLSYNTYVARRRKGWSAAQALSAPSSSSKDRGKSFTYNGVTYPTLTAARAVNGITAVCYYQRLRMGWSVEEAMGFVPRAPRNRHSRQYEIAGQTFTTLRDAALAFKIPLTTLTSRLSRGLTLAQALGTEPPPPKGPRKPRKQSPRFDDEAGTFYIGGKKFSWKDAR